jgi:hypothetical protein
MRENGICGGNGNDGEPCVVDADCPNSSPGRCRKGCVNGDSSCFCYDTAPNPTVKAGAFPDPSNADCSLISPLPTGTNTCVPGDTCVNKMNMTYAWGGGYYATDDTAIVGTGANTGCRAIATIALSGMDIPGSASTMGGTAVCEPGDSQFPNYSTFILEGDVRPPEVWYVTNVSSGPDPAANQHQIDLTTCPNNGYDLVRQAAGFRSVGVLTEKGLAIAAGPHARSDPPGGVIMVLIDLKTNPPQCLQVVEEPDITDVRKMQDVNGALYIPVGWTAGMGAVLRCTGCEQDPPNLDNNEIVANLNSLGANITYCPNQNVLLVNTWPNSDAVDPGAITIPAIDLTTISITSILDVINAIQTFLGVLSDVGIGSVYVSPVIPPHLGLTPADADNWDLIMTMDDYDPNWDTYQTSGFGGIACDDTYAYTGTMQVQNTGTVLHDYLFEPDLLAAAPGICVGGDNPGALCTAATVATDCPNGGSCPSCSCSNNQCVNNVPPNANCCVNSLDPTAATFCDRQTASEENTVRATSVFRFSNFGRIVEDPTIELMEGDQMMPAYATSVLDIFLNLALPTVFPLEWTMTPNGLAPGGMAPTCGRSGISASPTTADDARELDRLYTWTATECGGNIIIGDLDLTFSGGGQGADIYAFMNDQCPVALTETGAGNEGLWGFRTGQCVGGNKYLVGTATLRNLQVGDQPWGGWELRLLDLTNAMAPFPPVTPP